MLLSHLQAKLPSILRRKRTEKVPDRPPNVENRVNA
jgi:hypothetical protein